MDPDEFDFYIGPSGHGYFRGETALYNVWPEITSEHMFNRLFEHAGRRAQEIDVGEAARLGRLWNAIRDVLSPLRTHTIYKVEAFLEPGQSHGGAAVFVELRMPRGSSLKEHPERKRWGKGGHGYYIIRQEAINLAKVIESAGFVSFIEERDRGDWDVGAYVEDPAEAKDLIRIMETYIRAEMPLRLSWFTMA